MMCVTNSKSEQSWQRIASDGNRKGERETNGCGGSNRQNKATAGSIAHTTYRQAGRQASKDTYIYIYWDTKT